MEVTIVQRPKQLMNPFDPDMASFIHGEMRRHGVKLALGYTVEGFAERDGGVDVLLKDGAPLHADMVVLAIGVTPDTALARAAGLELGIRDSIVVNDRMETSVPWRVLPTSRAASRRTTSAAATAVTWEARAAPFSRSST